MRPLPVPQPDRLFRLGVTTGDDVFSHTLYEQLRTAAGKSAQIVLVGAPNRVEVQGYGDDAPYEQVTQQVVAPETLDVLGVSPELGRLFSPATDQHSSARAPVVLGFEYWNRRFGGDRDVVGRTLMVDGQFYSIAGVARKGFTGTEPGKFVDIWLPVAAMDPNVLTNPDIRLFYLMGRLGPGVTRQQIAAALQPTFYEHQQGRARMAAARLVASDGANGISEFRRTFARPLWILFAVAASILLLACANVASLLLARSTARSAEMALRISLGARRARLVRQLMTESLLIAAVAGLAGWALARVAAPTLVGMVSSQANPVRLDLSLNQNVLLFCVAICGLASVFFGLLPAWQATGSRPIFALRHAGGMAGRLRLGRVFVGVQIAVAFCLLVGGSGFLLSLRNLTAIDAGFDSQGVTVLTMTKTNQRNRQLPLLHQIQQRTASLPNVKGVATAWMPILSGARRAQRLAVPGKQLSEREETFYRVSPDYFATLRTPLLSGRDFTYRDNDDEPVPTVVNRAFARRYFETEAVLGREFRRDDNVRHQIVGVAENSQFGDLRSGPEPIAYMPMKPPRAFTMYVRSTLDAGTVAKLVEREARTLDPAMRVRDVTTVDALVGNTILKEKLLAGIGGAFAFLGILLASLGLFGLLNYSVTLRTREIAIRTAVGAERWPIYSMLLKDLAGMVSAGLAAGLAGSFALLSVTRSLLYGIGQMDARVIGAAAAIFLAGAVVACWIPARRAAGIDPVLALRHE
jgi:predicted permease